MANFDNVIVPEIPVLSALKEIVEKPPNRQFMIWQARILVSTDHPQSWESLQNMFFCHFCSIYLAPPKRIWRPTCCNSFLLL